MTETKSIKLEIKELTDTGSFSGYLSVFNVEDDDNDIVTPGAFKVSIASKRTIPILWQHDQKEPIGLWTKLVEDQHGLYVEGQLAVSTEQGNRAYQLLKMGAIDGLSIGYIALKFDRKLGVRYLTEVKLLEGSVVTFPANTEATVDAVKSAGAKTKEIDGEELPSSAFAFVGDPADESTWKLPIHFSTTEKSAAHIRNALARFGETEGIPEGDRAKVLARIQAAAHSHGIDVNKAAALPVEEKAMLNFTDALAARQAKQDLRETNWDLESAKDDSIDDIMSDEKATKEEKKAAIRKTLHDHADASANIHDKMVDALPEPEAGHKSMTRADKAKLASVLSMHSAAQQKCMKGMSLLHNGMEMHTKAVETTRLMSYAGINAADGKTPTDPEGMKQILTALAEIKAATEAATVISNESGDPEGLQSLSSTLRDAAKLFKPRQQ